MLWDAESHNAYRLKQGLLTTLTLPSSEQLDNLFFVHLGTTIFNLEVWREMRQICYFLFQRITIVADTQRFPSDIVHSLGILTNKIISGATVAILIFHDSVRQAEMPIVIALDIIALVMAAHGQDAP